MRNKFHIICEGDNLPPAVMDFADARLPASILKLLESEGIKRPTPIQMQVGQGRWSLLHMRWKVVPG